MSVRSLVVRTVHCAIGLVAAPLLFQGCSSDAVVIERTEKVAKASSAATVTFTGLYDTGVDNNGAPLADGTVDPHYVLTTSGDALYPTPNAYVLNFNYYANNSGTAKWINADATDGYGTDGLLLGDYTYRLTFTLANVDPTKASISGSWACDDTCTIFLNGTQVASLVVPLAWTTLVPFTIPFGSPFVIGTNTLDFVVHNNDNGGTRNPSGLVVDSISGFGYCTSDLQCPNGQWCNDVDANPAACQAKIPSGTQIAGGACNTPIPARACVSQLCDPTTTLCADCTATDTSACSPTKPVCNTAAGLCAPCNSNATGAAGGTPALRCPVATPYCTASGACSAACQNDAQCGAGNWCNDVTANPHACQPQVANGNAIPGNACSSALAARACVTGACDTNGNVCGIKLNDKTCASTVQCIDGTCLLTGANAGTCAPCTQDADCAAPKPVCSTTQNKCVQCNAQKKSQCTDTTPVCDVAAETCVACNGDFGSNATAPCPTAAEPVCATSTGKCSAATPPDAGPPDSGPPPVDAGPDAAPDAATPVDAAAPEAGPVDASVPRDAAGNADTSLQPVPDDAASLEGSGLSCASTPSSRVGSSMAAGVLALAQALRAYRRRRARGGSST